MKLAQIAVVLFFSPGFLAITGCPTSMFQSHVIHLTEKDSGKTLTISKAQELIVTLPNRTDGGYRFDKEQVDTTILRLKKYMEKRPAPNSGLGAPGEATWQFVALKKGTTILKITASRPWTKAGVITEFENTILVK